MAAEIELLGVSEEYENIRLCLETLLAVRAGSQPLDRELGIDYDMTVGYPVNVAMNMLALEIIEKVEHYEPRVKVESVNFGTDTDGMLSPCVRVKAKESV